jgi:hypothetical protein
VIPGNGWRNKVTGQYFSNEKGEKLYETFLSIRIVVCAIVRGRPQRSVPDLGRNRRQSDPEILAVDLRAVVAEEKRAETADGTERHPNAAQRAANAHRFHQ